MNVFLVIDKEVFPITIENDAEIFNLKENILSKFEEHIKNRQIYIENCVKETNRFNSVLHKHRDSEIVELSELNLKYPPEPNGGRHHIEFKNINISEGSFTDYRNGKLKKMNISIYKESEFWAGYKEHLKSNLDKHLEKK